MRLRLPRPGREERVRWPAVLFTVAGVGLLWVSGTVLGGYWQNVLINVGTTFLLFAGLALCEKYILTALRRPFGPRDLPEAQRRLLGALHPATHQDAVRDTFLAVGAQLTGAGLVQGPPSYPTDEYRRPPLTWRLHYEATAPGGGRRISHELLLNGRRWTWRPTDLSGGADVTEEDRDNLTGFERQVFGLIRDVAEEIART